MKRINKKGFTLIELLAVIVIMGILMMVAIPAVSRTIENARKDTFIETAQSYANAVQTLWYSDGLVCGDNIVASAVDDGDYYIEINTRGKKVNNRGVFTDEDISVPTILESGGKSSWGNRDVTGYIRVHVESTDVCAYYSAPDSVVDCNIDIPVKVVRKGGKRKTYFFVAISDGTHQILDDYSPLAISKFGTESSKLDRKDIKMKGNGYLYVPTNATKCVEN